MGTELIKELSSDPRLMAQKCLISFGVGGRKCRQPSVGRNPWLSVFEALTYVLGMTAHFAEPHVRVCPITLFLSLCLPTLPCRPSSPEDTQIPPVWRVNLLLAFLLYCIMLNECSFPSWPGVTKISSLLPKS